MVDAVLSEDVDTLMFGSGLTLKNWSPEGVLKTKTATHVNVYDAAKTKAGKSGLDRDGMILVAIMSGGDYIPEGIPGCGPKTACEAARAGFGGELCELARKKDHAAIESWKTRLKHELRTNESKHFTYKRKALDLPEDFPRLDVLKYYVRPCVSPADKVEQLRTSLPWDQSFDVAALRRFTLEAFDWRYLSGAKHFVRGLAPALLVKELRLRAAMINNGEETDDVHETERQESALVRSLHTTRTHVSTDSTPEIRVGFVPLDLVGLDLDAEEPDPTEDEMAAACLDSDDEAGVIAADDEPPSSAIPAPSQDGHLSPRKRPRTASKPYDPSQVVKAWILEIFVKVGVPLKVQDWAESKKRPKGLPSKDAFDEIAATGINARQGRSKAQKLSEVRKKHCKSGGMAPGAIRDYARVTKPTSTIPGDVAKRDEIEETSQKRSAVEKISLTQLDPDEKAHIPRQAAISSSQHELPTRQSKGNDDESLVSWITSQQITTSPLPHKKIFRMPATATARDPPPSPSGSMPRTPSRQYKQVSIVDLLSSPAGAQVQTPKVRQMNLVTDLTKSPSKSPSKALSTTPHHERKKQSVIRLRESLAGSWALSSCEDVEQRSSVGSSATTPKPAKSKHHWMVSDVETLDLSNQ